MCYNIVKEKPLDAAAAAGRQVIMEITRTFESDYNRYKHVRFTVMDELPEIGSIEDNPGCYRRKVTDIIDVTNSANYCDEGDGGYYSLYKVWYDVEQYQLDTD